MRLLLIRHGQTPSNVAGALDTAYPGAGLTDLGERQAAAIPAALEGEKIIGVYASPLVRTQLTATPLAERLGLHVEARSGLEEISAGDYEMRTDHDAVEGYHAALHRWLDGDLDARLGGNESGKDFLTRYDGAIRTIAQTHGAGDTVAVVSHGAAIRIWVSLHADPDRQTDREMRLANTAVAFVEGDPINGWRLERWHTGPIGGDHLVDPSAHDVTGDPEDEALAEADE